MSLNRQDVENIARLARLRLPPAQLEAMAGELSQILAFVEQLNGVDTTGVEPLLSVSQVTLPQRADVVTDGAQQDRVLANAPEKMQGFFVVPKVVGGVTT
jgi:aspartyl-tRNA(Asn)/glutamyl-tRNA(Gln) amidotransferase subunit C